MDWTGELNAEIYDEFARERGLYAALNAELARRADLPGARRILDLACGTGATTRAILAAMDRDAEVVGLDAAEDMLDVARRTVNDPRARFVHARARDAARIAGERPFDRALCNAAFWQFPDSAAVLAALSAALAPAGLFVLNLPASRLRGFAPEPHAFQVALGAAVQRATGGAPSPARVLDADELKRAAEAAGLSMGRIETFEFSCSQGELVDLMRIPALLRPLLPGLDDEGAARVVAEVATGVDEDERVVLPWVFMAFRRA